MRLNTCLFIIMLFLALLHIHSGFLDISLWKVLSGQASSSETLVMSSIRLPRTLLVVLIGFGLGISGAAIQAHVRNPLAEPSLLGISSSAAVLSVLVFYFGGQAANPLLQPLLGITGALASAVLLVVISSRGYSIATLVLAGVAINAFAGSLISLLINFAPNPFAVGEIVYWLLGSVTNRGMQDVYLVLPFTLAGSLLILLSTRWLNVLALGSDVAASMGFDRRKNEILVVSGIALAVGSGVSVAGIIGFIGLAVPHITRPLAGNLPGNSLLPSGLMGAGMLALADILVLSIPSTTEIRLGVITALLGAPFFLYIALANREDINA